jgi:hypothetical protein
MFVPQDCHEGVVDLQTAVVFDVAELLELLHEEVDARPRGADHFRERLLREQRPHTIRRAWLAVMRQQEQRASQPLLTGIEQLIDHVLLDANVSSQRVRDEAIREFLLSVEQRIICGFGMIRTVAAVTAVAMS